MAPSRFAPLNIMKARGRKISQLSASSCSIWSERFIRSCSSVIPGAFVLEKTHPLYKVNKRLSALLVTFGSNKLLRLIPRNLAECCVNSTCRITPCPQVIVIFSTLLKPDVYLAWVCEQPVYFCFRQSTKVVPRMIWTVWEIRLGVPWFPV